MSSPRLFQDLRMALACLYSLSPGSTGHIPSMDSRQAHDFLLYLQTRNVRRKLQSLQQSDRDQQKKSPQEDSPQKNLDDREGSTWLACLALLCCADADSAERLFAAQTLMHRLRRTKLSEAIDLEMENPSTLLLTVPVLTVNLTQMTTDYANYMHQFHPVLGTLVEQFLSQGAVQQDTTNDEDFVKGQLTMLTLSAITFMTACSSHDVDPNMHALICTLGSCMAATALRLRFTPQSVMTSITAATSTTAPLVTMVVQSLSFVATAAARDAPPQQVALYKCLCSCLAALPDTLLASPGGALGRFSVDPRCVQAAHQELRHAPTGVHLVWEALCRMPSSNVVETFLRTCQKWTKYLPLPLDFIDHTVPLAASQLLLLQQVSCQKAALAYLICIYESASWTALHILSFSLGLSSEQLSNQQVNKKRQTSRSKRRQKELLDSNATDTLWEQAEEECRHRGETACRTTRLIWDSFITAVQRDYSGTLVDGEGAVGCLCACANACLPHWVRYQSSISVVDKELILSVMEAFQNVCSHVHGAVRGLAYEPLYTLHTALLTSARARDNNNASQSLTEMESIVVNHLYQCAMRLATSCGYPADYFNDLSQDNDDEMEMERNDVRDVIRAISGAEDSSSSADESTGVPLDVSMRILDQLVQSCAQACNTYPLLPPETAVHALSALAKPVNRLAELYSKGFRREGVVETLTIAIQGLGNVHKSLVPGFTTLSIKELFPVSRLANLATASFAPSLSCICKLGESGECDLNLLTTSRETVDAAVHSAALSIVHIPELAAASTLDHTQYDIRGAMRGPGGEDHVGVLALLRLAFESDELARVMIAADSSTGASLPMELCKLHDTLKSIENERGLGVIHGKGVGPKSRRILLQTISRLILLRSSDAAAIGQSTSEDQDALRVLNDLFLSLISSIATLATPPTAIDVERMYRICQGVYDLASFSPSMVCKIFHDIGGEEAQSVRHQFLHGLVEAGQLGYVRHNSQYPPDDVILQWARLRGGLFALLRASACPDLPRPAIEAIILLNKAECQAIASQFQVGPSTASAIFNESVISENFFAAGAFVRVLGDIIEEQGHVSTRNCIFALHELRTVVLDTILLQSPEPTNPAFVDPRPTLYEAWLVSLTLLMTSFNRVSEATPQTACNDPHIRSLLSESCCALLLLLLFASLEKDQNERAKMGMTLDGAHTRAALEFLECYFLLGPEMLREVALLLRSKLDIDVDDNLLSSQDATSQGVAIVGACLFRAASGGLPPWAIEVIPPLYAALYHACGTDAGIFCQMLMLSMEVRLKGSGFGSVRPGELLAGRFLETAKASSKQAFVEKSHEACSMNNPDGWRRFKVLLKQACGGKKKSSLSLKPSYTTWDIDRL